MGRTRSVRFGPVVATAAWLVLAGIGLSPLAGQIDPSLGPLIVPAVALAGAGAWFGPRVARWLPWRWLLAASFFAALAWAALVALGEGPGALTAPLTTRYEYLHDLPRISSPAAFLTTFVEDIGTYTTHVRGHPPGVPLILWMLDRVGLAGPGWAAALVVMAGASAVPATLVAMREVAGSELARRTATFLAFLPAAVWVATSADALFAGVGAWAVTSVIVSLGRTGLRSALWAIVGGVLFGAAAFLTYGAVLLAIVPIAVAVARRRLGPLLLALAGSAVVAGAFAATGFWWFDGLRATAREVRLSSLQRGYVPFLLFNLAVFAIALGPAVAAGLVRLRDGGTWLLVGGALAAVLAADLSGLSKGEVERIWLPFVPWVAVAAGALDQDRPAVTTAWVAGQAFVALAVQTLVRTPW